MLCLGIAHTTILVSSLSKELGLMFSLLDRIDKGVDRMLADLEGFIMQSGLDDMKACASVITTVRACSYPHHHTHTYTCTYICPYRYTHTHIHVYNQAHNLPYRILRNMWRSY